MTDNSRLLIHEGSVLYKDRTGAPVYALNEVSFAVKAGETLGIVGESGCGKSSLAKLIAHLTSGVRGKVYLDGKRIDKCSYRQWKPLRRRIQYVFQDPLGALDPRMSILKQVKEPLDIHGIGSKNERRESAEELLLAVGIGKHLFKRSPIEISGGQRQRVILARALILKPDVLLCDEPVSALDVSIQAQVLNLLIDLRAKFGLTILFISHDLAVVKHISHSVGVMYLGRFVEMGEIDAIFSKPAHPYTRALLDALPKLGGRPHRLRLSGETPPASSSLSACPFSPRCPAVDSICRRERPALVKINDKRFVACHFPYIMEMGR